MQRLVFAHSGWPTIAALDAGWLPRFGEFGVGGAVYSLSPASQQQGQCSVRSSVLETGRALHHDRDPLVAQPACHRIEPGSQRNASAMTTAAAVLQPSTTSSPVAGIGHAWVAGLNAASIARATGATGKAEARL
jgi:hypothetical protein